MTQDMGNKISHHNQAVVRKLAGSKQALGRLMSMVRSRQGGGKEQARSWLEYGWEVSTLLNLPKPATSRS